MKDAGAAVAFTARALSGNHEYADGDTVIFPQIITNIGGHYNSSTSKFTCPVDGTYMFAVNFLSAWEEEVMRAEIVKEGVALVGGFVDYIEGEFNTGSAMAITACSAQEQVLVRSSGLGKMYGGYYCHFSGFLLFPIV